MKKEKKGKKEKALCVSSLYGCAFFRGHVCAEIVHTYR